MKCENCGAEINSLIISVFNRDGSDIDIEIPIEEGTNGDDNTKWVRFQTNQNWMGYELSEEEQHENICCPICKKPAFKNTEVQVYDVVEIVRFKKEV